jgi:hypothetical protein
VIRIEKTLAEVAGLVQGRIIGDKDLKIRGLSGIKEAQAGPENP